MIKLSNFLKSTIMIILLLEVRFFFLINNSRFNSSTNKSLILFISFVVFIVSFKFIDKKKIFTRNIIIFFVVYTIEVLLSSLLYQQNIIDTINISGYNMVIILYFSLQYFSKNKENIEFLYKIIIIFTGILSFILILQWIYYEQYSVIFLKINLDKFRFGSLRIYEAGNFIEIGVVLAYGRFLITKIKKHKIYLGIVVILGLFEILFVAKGRLGLLIVITSIIIMSMYILVKDIKKAIITIITSILFILIIFNTTMFNNVIKSFSNNEFQAGSDIRRNAITYYINQVKQKPLFGIGYPYFSDKKDDNYYLLRGYEKSKYYRDDVGIIGFLNTFGLIGFTWYLMLFYKIIKVIIISHKRNVLKNYISLLGFVIIIIFQSFSTIIMDPQRIIMLPILLTMIDGLYNINNNLYKA